ncbi:MAG: hypothetical protein LQ340_004165 [Diploschistes diacapsis]|nr:MAG: hypothetical protein LQ340_004165 [Diploschistes diacapsis]
MVVRAIRQNNPRARVNERHDIVLDTGSPLEEAAHLAGQDTHHTAYEPGSPLKVSGSAYKLTRTRALHHGTCLVNSERVGMISGLLRSPLAPFVKARGVDSVKSAVGNVYGTQYGGAVELFKANVIQEFCRTYAIDAAIGRQLLRLDSATTLETFDNGIYGVLDEDLGKIEKIKEGMWEMRSTDWLYGQTPQFTFSTFSTADDPRPRPLPPSPIPSSSRVHFTARGSRITSAEFALSPSTILDSNCIVGQELHRLDTWKKLLRIDKARSKEQGEDESNVLALADWLDEIFGMRTYCSA